jgi:hypothetical protein
MAAFHLSPVFSSNSCGLGGLKYVNINRMLLYKEARKIKRVGTFKSHKGKNPRKV